MTPEPLPIPHNGVKPDWLEPETLIKVDPPVKPGCQAGAHGFFLGQAGRYTWDYLTPRKHVFLPADHWAYPVLAAGLTPWNPTLQGAGPPKDYAGGKVMFRDGHITGPAPSRDWYWEEAFLDIIGYEPSPATPADADLVEYTDLCICGGKFDATELQSLRDKLRVAVEGLERFQKAAEPIMKGYIDKQIDHDLFGEALVELANVSIDTCDTLATIRSAT